MQPTARRDGGAVALAELRFGRFELRPSERRLLADGVPVPLGGRALDLLEVLVSRPGRLLTRKELLERVWPDAAVEEGNLSVQINALRKVLGPELIATVPGRGYCFTQHPNEAGRAASPTAAAATGLRAQLLAALPFEGAPLLGRANELAALTALVDEHRLVTLLGAGGVGKTRLAQALLHGLRARRGQDVGWVELGEVSDAAALPGVIAGALRVATTPHDPLAALARALEPLDLVVVLDNAEHLVAAVARVSRDLLAAAPRLRLLVTSQAKLALAGERVMHLSPLSLPAGPLPPEEALTHGAIQLFTDRAQAADSRFRLDAANVAAVTELCVLLGGVPLAIELAAARAPWMGLSALLVSMNDHPLQLRRAAHAGAPRRQQTLRDALEWSHGLLQDREQAVFRRLAVVAGSASMDFILDIVTDAPGDAGMRWDRWAVLDGLGELVDRSLVSVVADEDTDNPRYRLLDAARVYAGERLAAAGEQPLMKQRHMQAMAARCTAWWDRYHDGSIGQDALLDQISLDLANAQDAWATARAAGNAAAALAIGALMLLPLTTAYADQRLEVLQGCETMDSPAVPPGVRLRAWLAITTARGPIRPRRLRAPATRALELARAHDAEAPDRFLLYCALSRMSWAAAIESDEAAARAALAELQEIEDVRWPPHRRYLGVKAAEEVAYRFTTDQVETLRLVRRSHEMAMLCGNRRYVGWGNLILAELSAGDAESAARTGRAHLLEVQQQRNDRGLAYVRINLLSALLVLGLLEEARPLARQGWPQAERYQAEPTWGDNLADLSSREGRHQDAVLLIGFADAAYVRLGDARAETAPRVAQALARAEAALGADTVQRLLREGQRLSTAEVPGLAFGPQA